LTYSKADNFINLSIASEGDFFIELVELVELIEVLELLGLVMV
jgi:hypothetical protein